MRDRAHTPDDDEAATESRETAVDRQTDERLEEVPNWDDEYVDRVSDRLLHNYDLEKDFDVGSEQFTLYGKMELVSKKQFLHPALSIAEHESTEHLFVGQVDRVDDRTLDRFVDLGKRLADEWIEPNEEHFCTEFTFVVIAPSIPDSIRERVAGFDGRTMLKYGFHGHYEINLAVVAPDSKDLVASENADVATAFRLWEPLETGDPGLLDRLSRRLGR